MFVPLTEEEQKEIKPRLVLQDVEHYNLGLSMQGMKVCKISGRPFKSTLKVNTCTGVVRNKHTHLWALTFAEDDSTVEVRMLKIHN